MVRVYQSKLLVKHGRYGASKAKCFAAMGKEVWTSRQLCLLTGIGYHSLGRTLCRWVRFGYLARGAIEYGGDYAYRLEPKGRKWLSLAARYLPNYDLFLAELNTWQDSLPEKTINKLLSMPFNDFVSMLDAMVREFQENKRT